MVIKNESKTKAKMTELNQQDKITLRLIKTIKRQYNEIEKIKHLLSLTSDTCEQQVDELIEKQKEIEELKTKLKR